MDRKEIANVLKDILDNYHELILASLTIIPPNAADIKAQGEQLHIIVDVSESTKQCLKRVVKRYGLALRDQAGKIVIYRSAAQQAL